MSLKLSAFLFLFGLFLAQQQQEVKSQEVFEVRLPCVFETRYIFEFINYACIVRNFTFDFSNPFYYIVIEGQHERDRTNVDVRNLIFEDSDINQIPANIFQVFPNIIAMEVNGGGVTALTGADLIFSRFIEGLFVNNNNIPVLGGFIFMGRNTITHMNLYSNRITAIQETTFNGLPNLRYLSLGGNLLTTLPPDVLTPLVGLRTFLASFNQIESLSPRTFRTNRQLEVIAFEFNNINALGPRIFDDLPSVQIIGLLGNECVSEEFELGEERTIVDVNDALTTCFDNSIPDPPRRRQLVFELRGNMTLNNEYGEEIANVVGRAW